MEGYYRSIRIRAGENERMRRTEWTLGSKLLGQSIFPLGALDESCPNLPLYFK